MTNNTSRPHHIRALDGALANRAKVWWGVNLSAKVISILLGALTTTVFPEFKYGALVVLLFYFLSEVAVWRSDTFKGMAEGVHSKLDLNNSFGWEISGVEMSNILSDVPRSIAEALPPPGGEDTYFASRLGPGPLRAMENLQESSWWSKNLARRMSYICLGVMIALILGSAVAFRVSLTEIQDVNTRANIGQLITTVLMLILSLGLWRLVLGYYKFSSKASRSEERALALSNKECSDIDALRAWNEYQLARAAAPLLPGWIWRINQKRLNEWWKTYRRGRTTVNGAA